MTDSEAKLKEIKKNKKEVAELKKKISELEKENLAKEKTINEANKEISKYKKDKKRYDELEKYANEMKNKNDIFFGKYDQNQVLKEIKELIKENEDVKCIARELKSEVGWWFGYSLD